MSKIPFSLEAEHYDARYPLFCFDERPCFLIGDKVEPLSLLTGQVRREHYEYEKLGSCSLLASIEPLTGNRIAQVYPRRTKREYTLHCQSLAMYSLKCHTCVFSSGGFMPSEMCGRT